MSVCRKTFHGSGSRSSPRCLQSCWRNGRGKVTRNSEVQCKHHMVCLRLQWCQNWTDLLHLFLQGGAKKAGHLRQWVWNCHCPLDFSCTICWPIIRPHSSNSEILPIATDAVAWSACVSVCWSHFWALQKWLNRSRCCLGRWVEWAQVAMHSIGVHIPQGEGTILGRKVVAHCNV